MNKCNVLKSEDAVNTSMFEEKSGKVSTSIVAHLIAKDAELEGFKISVQELTENFIPLLGNYCIKV